MNRRYFVLDVAKERLLHPDPSQVVADSVSW